MDEVKRTILEGKEGSDVYHITCEGEPIDSFESEDEANKHLNIYKDKHPEKEFIIEKQKYNSHSDMIDKLDEMGETFEVKETKTMEKKSIKVKNLAQAILDAKERGLSEIKVGTESYNVDECWKKLEEEEMHGDMSEDSEMGESNAFIVAADAARDAGKKEFEFPKGSGEMHKVTIKQDIDINEGEDTCDSCGKPVKDCECEGHDHNLNEGHGECNECGAPLNEEGNCQECSMMKEEDDIVINSLDQLDQMNESKKATLRLTESELVSLISKMVSESVPGIVATKRAQKGSGDESKAHMADVEKKLKDISTFDGNDNPEFPNQITKGDKVAERTTDEENETIEDNRGGGMEDLNYDYEPSERFKIRLKKALEGDSTMGNSQDAANVIPSKTGENMAKKLERKAKKLADEKQVSWGHRGIEPLDVKTVNESKTTMSSVLEEEVQRMKKILGYNEKTQ